jgi:hypothetical protein
MRTKPDIARHGRMFLPGEIIQQIFQAAGVDGHIEPGGFAGSVISSADISRSEHDCPPHVCFYGFEDGIGGLRIYRCTKPSHQVNALGASVDLEPGNIDGARSFDPREITVELPSGRQRSSQPFKRRKIGVGELVYTGDWSDGCIIRIPWPGAALRFNFGSGPAGLQRQMEIRRLAVREAIENELVYLHGGFPPSFGRREEFQDSIIEFNCRNAGDVRFPPGFRHERRFTGGFRRRNRQMQTNDFYFSDVVVDQTQPTSADNQVARR